MQPKGIPVLERLGSGTSPNRTLPARWHRKKTHCYRRRGLSHRSNHRFRPKASLLGGRQTTERANRKLRLSRPHQIHAGNPENVPIFFGPGKFGGLSEARGLMVKFAVPRVALLDGLERKLHHASGENQRARKGGSSVPSFSYRVGDGG